MGALRHTDSSKAAILDVGPDYLPQKTPPRRYGRRLFWLIVLMVLAALGYALSREMDTSRWQARQLSRWAADLDYRLAPGASDAQVYPGAGPFDKRLGYSDLPQLLPRLIKRDYVIVEQARFSAALLDYTRHGLFVPYAEKIQAGLSITDCRAAPLYHFNYPQQLYSDFAAIPPLVVNSLLFIERPRPARPCAPPGQPGGRLAAFRHGGMVASGAGAEPARPERGRQYPGDPIGKIPPLTRRSDPKRRRKDPPDALRQRARLRQRPRHRARPASHRA